MDGETRFVTLGSLFRVFLLVVASISAGAVVGIMASLYHAAFFPWGFLAIMMALIAGLVGLRVFFRPPPKRLVMLTASRTTSPGVLDDAVILAAPLPD